MSEAEPEPQTEVRPDLPVAELSDDGVVVRYVATLVALYDRLFPDRRAVNRPYRARGISPHRVRSSGGLILQTFRIQAYGDDHPGAPYRLLSRMGSYFLTLPVRTPFAAKRFLAALDYEPLQTDDPVLGRLYGRDGPFGMLAVRAVDGLDLPRLPVPGLLPGFSREAEIADAADRFHDLLES